MQNNTNHRQPAQPVLAPPALAERILARIQEAERVAQESAQIATVFASSDWTQRASLCARLAHMERAQALPWLQRALSDTHPTVRATAVYALSLHQADELLHPLLADASWQVREAVALALGLATGEASPEQSKLSASTQEQDQMSRSPLSLTLSGGNIPMKSMEQSSSRSFEAAPPTSQWPEPFAPSITPGQHREEVARPARRIPRFLTLAAVLLVCAVLIGSMALVFSAIKSNSTRPGPGGRSGTGSAAPTATATPTTIPPECSDIQDQIEEALCAQHQETTLNITKNFSGHSVTFVRAYADISRFLLVFTTTDSPHSDVISFSSVTVQPNIKLSGGGQVAYQNPSTLQWYYVLSFSTSHVPAGTKTLHVASIVDTFSGSSTPLQFSLPFHSQPAKGVPQIVTINRTVTSKGIALTLEQVDFAADSTTFYFKASQSLQMTLYVKALTINGQQVAGTKDNLGSRDALVIPIAVPLANKHGAWKLQMMEGQGDNQIDWTFTFTISDTTQTS